MLNRQQNNRPRVNVKSTVKKRGGRFSLPSFSKEQWKEWLPHFRTMLLVMLTPVIALQGYRYFTTSEHFTVRHVELSGNHRLTQDEVMGFAGIEVGESLFELDEKVLARELERHPRIRHAEVRVDIPDRIRIAIEERAAAAVVVLEALYLADDRGVVFKPVGPRDDIEGLPIVSGISKERLEDNVTAKAEEMVIREAIDLSVAYASHEVARAKGLGELHHDPLFGWTIITESDSMEVKVGSGKFKQKLDRLEHILRDLEARGARADVVRLDSVKDPDRVAVRMHYKDREVNVLDVQPSKVPVQTQGGARLPPQIHQKSPPVRGKVKKKSEIGSKLDEILGE